MWSRLSVFILRNRVAFLAAILAVTGFMAYQSQFSEMDYNFAQVLPNDDPTFVDYTKFKEKFGEEAQLLIIGISDSSIYELEKFQSLVRLTDSLQEVPAVNRVISFAQSYNVIKNEDLRTFELEQVFTDMPQTQEEVDAIKKKIKRLKFYQGLLVNPETNASLVILSMEPSVMNSEARIKVVAKIDRLSKKFTQETGIETHTSGLPYIRTRNAEKIKSEINLFIFLALGVTAIILLIFLKSLKATLFSMTVVAIGVIWSLGSMALLGFKMTILTGLIPPLIIVIGIPNCIFLINKFHSEYRSHGNKIKALSRIIEKIGNATLMTNATTASGFATFIITESYVLSEFGIVASLNIMAVFVLSITLIPIFFSYFPDPKVKEGKTQTVPWVAKVVNWMVKVVTRQRPVVYVTVSALTLLAIIGTFKIYTTGSITEDIPRDDKIYKDLKFFESNFNGLMPFEILVDTKRPNGAISPSTLRKIDELQAYMDSVEEFARPYSITDISKFAKQAFYNGDPKFYSLPSNQERTFISSYIQEAEDGSTYYQGLIDSSLSTVRITGGVTDIGIKRMRSLRADLEERIDEIFDPERFDITITGTSVLYLRGTEYLVKNLFVSLALAVLLIAIFMAWMFRSARMVLVSLLPNLLPLLFTAAIMGFAGITLKPSTILVFSIAFGISVDDTIHFLAKYRQELKARNWNIRESVIAALKETGLSMIYTSIVLFFGFSIFIASNFGGTIALGMLVSITLMIAMFSNLILLPTLLLTLERLITTKSFKEPMIHIYDEEEDIELNELVIEEKQDS